MCFILTYFLDLVLILVLVFILVLVDICSFQFCRKQQNWVFHTIYLDLHALRTILN